MKAKLNSSSESHPEELFLQQLFQYQHGFCTVVKHILCKIYTFVKLYGKTLQEELTRNIRNVSNELVLEFVEPYSVTRFV
jgi:hypothetical protein